MLELEYKYREFAWMTYIFNKTRRYNICLNYNQRNFNIIHQKYNFVHETSLYISTSPFLTNSSSQFASSSFTQMNPLPMQAANDSQVNDIQFRCRCALKFAYDLGGVQKVRNQIHNTNSRGWTRQAANTLVCGAECVFDVYFVKYILMKFL